MTDSLLGLEDKVALVTGAGHGIGKAAALMLARAGARVAAVDIDSASAEETAGTARAIGVRAIAVAADVRSEDDVRGMVARTVAELGGLDVCVNNAGGTVGHPRVPFIEASTDFLDDAIDLNLRAVFFACQVEARSMIERGVGGSIINISSPRRRAPRAPRLRLRRREGGCDQPDADHGRRAWAPRHTDERHCPRDDGDSRGRCGGAIEVNASGGERQPAGSAR